MARISAVAKATQQVARTKPSRLALRLAEK